MNMSRKKISLEKKSLLCQDCHVLLEKIPGHDWNMTRPSRCPKCGRTYEDPM